jgi:hypothetical protein
LSDDIFKDRERAAEGQWARARDAELIEKLRNKEQIAVVTAALAEVLRVKAPELLQRVINLGVMADTAPAFLLSPLVQVAWAGLSVTDEEREAVLRLAAARGIKATDASGMQLADWLKTRPAEALFTTAIEVIRTGLAELPEAEREERVAGIAKACREVAKASGGLGKSLGLSSGVSAQEESIVDRIVAQLRA